MSRLASILATDLVAPPLWRGLMAVMGQRIQFSIRSLLVATVAVGAATAAVRAKVSINSALAIHCLSLFFATAAVVGVTQTTGKMRTFWIRTVAILGPLAMFAVMASASLLPRIGQEYMTPYGNVDWRYISILWFAAPLNGLLPFASTGCLRRARMFARRTDGFSPA